MARPRWLVRIALLLDAAVLLVALGVAWSMTEHDRQLEDVEQRLDDLPVPDGSRVIERGSAITDGHSAFSDIAVFSPHRDHCELRAWIVLETALDVPGLGRFYDDAAAETAGLSIGLRAPGRLRVEDVESRSPGWDPRCNRGFGL